MKKSFYLFLIVSLSLFVNWVSYADKERSDDEAVVEVPEVTVTATRAEKEPFKTPNAITVLDLKQLERTNADIASNLLQDVGGVIAQQTTVGQGSPMLRSLTGYQTLIQVDWVRLNNSTFRSGPNQYTATVSPEMLARAEVLLGSSSMLYGSGAMGGVVSFLYESGANQSGTGDLGSTSATSWSLRDGYTGKARSVRGNRKPRTIRGLSLVVACETTAM